MNIGQVLSWNYNVYFISNIECNLTEVKGFRFNDLSSISPILYDRHVELIWLSNITQVRVVNCGEIHSIPHIL
jgi:hypothetical protein